MPAMVGYLNHWATAAPQSHSFLCYLGFWQPVLCEINDQCQNYLQTEGLNIHYCAKKMHALQTILEAKREEFVDDALIYAKGLCEELEISFEPPRQKRRKHNWRRKHRCSLIVRR
ncbi:uncharacterized protein TNCV_3006001 [Trichonephila clavipes]|nr:uncharacterized protein TNCV_3006001 [Trichonephila clavipes]